MTIQRMDNVLIVVDDLDAVIAFFMELGMELEGKGPIEGAWVERVIGIDAVRQDVAMLRTPDGHGRVRCRRGGVERAGRARVPSDSDAGIERPRVSRSPRLAAARHAPDGRPRAVAHRQGSVDGPLSADRRRDHPHRTAAPHRGVNHENLVIWSSGHLVIDWQIG